MNRVLSIVITTLCGLFLVAFIAEADTVIMGDNYQVVQEVNTSKNTAEILPKLTNESSYCIVNQTTADFSVFINGESIWMEPGMVIWSECQNNTEDNACEIESMDVNAEFLSIALQCGDIVKIQVRN